MDKQESVSRATQRWTWSWMGLVMALALHVVDEAANDFLSFWNPLVLSLRQQAVAIPLPAFSFELWLGGLMAAVFILLVLTWCVRSGASWMRPVSYVLAVIMLGNGMLHIIGTVYQGRPVPGVYSSPILLIAAGLLLANAWRHRNVSASVRRDT